MSFTDAIRSVLTQYATFSGRARRSEYWFWVLVVFLVSLAASVLDTAMGRGGQLGIMSTLVLLATIVPSVAVAVRRLHDTGRSGAWWFIVFVPFIGGLVLLVFMVLDSGSSNQYGPNPKGVGYGAESPAMG